MTIAQDERPQDAFEVLGLDRASVRSIDQDGHLLVSRTPISKANVCEYYGREIPDAGRLGLAADQKYRLLRHPDELKKAAETSNGKPLLIIHKPLHANDHSKDVVVGSIGTAAAFEHPYLFNALSVWDGEAIDRIDDASQRELSSSYHYRADMTPGTYEGQAYDGVMRDIRFNHVALVREGRAGKDVLVMDENPQAVDAPWDEEAHPRDLDGRFGAGRGKPHADHVRHHTQRAREKFAAKKDAAGNAHIDAALAHQRADATGDLDDVRAAYAKSQSAYFSGLAHDDKPLFNFGAFAMSKPVSFAAFAADEKPRPLSFDAFEESKHPRKGGKFSTKGEIVTKAHRHFTSRHAVNIDRGAVEAHLLGGDHPQHKTLMSHLPDDYDGSDEHMKHAFGLEPHEVKRLAQDASWEESKHPRANNGQFGAGEGKTHAQHQAHHERKASEHTREIAKLRKSALPTEAERPHLAARHLHEEAALQHNLASQQSGFEHIESRAHEASRKAHEATEATKPKKETTSAEKMSKHLAEQHRVGEQYHGRQEAQHIEKGAAARLAGHESGHHEKAAEAHRVASNRHGMAAHAHETGSKTAGEHTAETAAISGKAEEASLAAEKKDRERATATAKKEDGQYGAGPGKSHFEHAEHHISKAREHATKAGDDFGGPHSEAYHAHQKAAYKHLHVNASGAAASVSHADRAAINEAHAASKAAHEASERAHE